MHKFNNETYVALVNDLINDAFYLEGASRRGTIAKIRQYAEVIVRRAFNIPEKERITLGDKKIAQKIQRIDNPLFTNAINYINKFGSDCTHTGFTDVVTEDDVKSVINELFNLYAYLLVDYFERYGFGPNMKILRVFSILPPIIRFYALENLYAKYPTNVHIIDRFILSIVKAVDKNEALIWLDERKNILTHLVVMSEKDKDAIFREYDREIAIAIISSSPHQICMSFALTK